MSSISLDLKGVHANIGSDNISNILESNFKMYYDWAFLSYLGAWVDVNVPTSGVYGGDFSTLRKVDDPNYTYGQVWEAARKDFVWESGVDYTNATGGISNPRAVGNPVVNGSTVTTGYYVDYPNGRVIFNSAQTGTVKLPYAYRYVQLYRIDDAPWWRELQYSSHRPDSEQFTQSSSGDWSIFGVNRIQLPAVVIEVVPRGTAKNWEMGSDSLIQTREVRFTIFAETSWERKNLMDIFNAQVDRNINLFDTNEASAESPLDYRGMLTGTKNYPYFNTGYKWAICTMQDSFVTDVGQIHPNLYIANVTTSTETIVGY